MEYIKNLCSPSKVYLGVSITIFIFNSIFNSNKKQIINIIPLIIRVFIITYLANYVCEKYGIMNSWYLIIFVLVFFPICLSILLYTYCEKDKYNKKCKTMFNVVNFLF